MNNENQEFTPCGEGENTCNCKSKEECGYKSEINKMRGAIEQALDAFDREKFTKEFPAFSAVRRLKESIS